MPCSATGEDGTVSFDGTGVAFDWQHTAARRWKDEERHLPLASVAAVEWGTTHLRFTVHGRTAPTPHRDPYAFKVFSKKELAAAAVLAAAVTAHLPHPLATATAAPEPAPPAARTDPDTVLRRVRELGELHRDGFLTDDEFTNAKRRLLRDL